jgi:hypothetical protein
VTFATREIEWSGQQRFRQSSARAQRGFCAACGTQLSFQVLASPETTDLTLASLDEPAAVWPEDHTFTRSQLPWLVFADGLPRFAAAREC